ncbi:MAG: hypothetical protein ACK417_05380 [Bacteroidia bacterium]
MALAALELHAGASVDADLFSVKPDLPGFRYQSTQLTTEFNQPQADRIFGASRLKIRTTPGWQRLAGVTWQDRRRFEMRDEAVVYLNRRKQHRKSEPWYLRIELASDGMGLCFRF